ncbi:MAG TPA: polyprenyl synthetase family protein, partial [Gaiella sp.]
MSALSTMQAVEGLSGYLEAVEERLGEIVEAHPGTVAAVGSDALAAGGKRMRPALTFLSSPPGSPPPVAEGAAIELVHMASLVHDDIVDEA